MAAINFNMSSLDATFYTNYKSSILQEKCFNNTTFISFFLSGSSGCNSVKRLLVVLVLLFKAFMCVTFLQMTKSCSRLFNDNKWLSFVQVPGPGEYKVVDMSFYRKGAPKVSIKHRPVDSQFDRIPGPGHYDVKAVRTNTKHSTNRL